MLPPRLRLASVIAANLLLFVGAPADASAQGPSWPELVHRDTRVSFTRRSGPDARVELMAGTLSSAERAAALMAIGCTEPQLVRDRPLLEAIALEGNDLERKAAILALGEFGPGADTALLDQLDGPDLETRGCAMLGLLLGGRSSSRVQVQAIASGGGADAELAGRLLVQTLDPGACKENPVGTLYFRLRWDAARRYGLVDGHSWMSRVLAELVDESRFLDGVVLGSVASSSALGIKDHLLAQLLRQSGAAEMRAAARAMPDELAAMIKAGLWRPRGPKGWRLMLDEIDLWRTEGEAMDLLALAIEEPEVEVHALLLLARAGLPEPLVGLDVQWPQLGPQDRRLAARAWALARTPEAVGWLIERAEDPDPQVRATMLVARARLGDATAHEELRDVLLDPEHPRFGLILEATAEQSDAPLARSYLEDLLPVVEDNQLLLVSSALARSGATAGRKALAEALQDGFPRGRAGALCVRALAGRDAAAHIAVFRQHFPAEDDLELNIALAQAIVEAQDDLALRFLRPALWSGPFDRSLLAALAITRVRGLHGLRDELRSAPLEASSRDLRRVGFAVGAWGGIMAVEFFQAKWGLMANDPVLQGAILGALGRRTH